MLIPSRRFSTEIVHCVFGHLFPIECKRALRYGLVCKRWFEVWLSHRWHTIDDLSRVLIVILGGLHINSSPTDTTWSRFEVVYTRHVKSVVVRPTRLFDVVAAFTLYRHLAQRYDTADTESIGKRIFPNLKSIAVNQLSLAHSPPTAFRLSALSYLFAHSGVKSFAVHDNVKRLQELLKIDLIFQAKGYSVQYYPQPSSATVEIYVSDIYVQDDEPMYLNIASNIIGAACKTAATQIDLPAIPSLIKSVAPLIDSLYMEGQGLPINVVFSIDLLSRKSSPKPPKLTTDHSSFQQLSLTTKLSVAPFLLPHVDIQNPLTTLKLDIVDMGLEAPARGDAIWLTFERIGVCCPALVELRFTVSSGACLPKPKIRLLKPTPALETVIIPRSEFITNDHAHAITFRMLYSLTKCKRLEVLEVRDLYPMSVDSDGFGRLVERWPKLRAFRLGYSRLDVVEAWRNEEQNAGQGRSWMEGLKKISTGMAYEFPLEALEFPVIEHEDLKTKQVDGDKRVKVQVLSVGCGVYSLMATKIGP